MGWNIYIVDCWEEKLQCHISVLDDNIWSTFIQLCSDNGKNCFITSGSDDYVVGKGTTLSTT